ncbi:tRNA (adenosine(37)-N6)-dimethylallyltransferase MiaA [Saccharophagus degradans]|uniref:tRNA (adenosine(37)-N6)-dimethylallyltransferase MiaA n=1 Tax=Saccharophagus degradans TaxID=86304 RepID=UPI002477E7DB|nr:tRNA (adenosine(37)-N6)-dimethylallyltransferase MiaA [Saccharophagus degradans]WGO99868.1 tRNA (adenosine(37)-N6)-dimethylallyltransferase MiaA [Saccharophagus degradans]
MAESNKELVDRLSAPRGDRKPLAIALVGPTAAGKTDLAIALHQQLGAEIISVDSAMVYRDMNIGTAKPTASELALAPHRLIDIRDPAEAYSVADFCRDAKTEIESIHSQGKIPVLAGGTMMYFKVLLEGLSDMPASDPAVRAQIDKRASEEGWPALHSELASVDPETAANIHPNHSHRISRALEVYVISGKPMSAWRGQANNGLIDTYDWVQICVAPRERTLLHQRIAQRFDMMLEQGFIDEVRALYDRNDLNVDMPSIRAVGYRQAWDYLEGVSSYDEMREKGIAATRQLAKRQFTWLRSWQGLEWIYTQDEDANLLSSEEIVNKALNYLAKRTI